MSECIDLKLEKSSSLPVQNIRDESEQSNAQSLTGSYRTTINNVTQQFPSLILMSLASAAMTELSDVVDSGDGSDANGNVSCKYMIKKMYPLDQIQEFHVRISTRRF